MARITAEQIVDARGTTLTVNLRIVASFLNDPAIRRLVVEAVIEEVRDPQDGTVRLLMKMRYDDPGRRVIELLPEELVAALCPATPNPEEPHG